MIGFLTATAAFIVVLAPLVTIHEFGHFLVAKIFRIGVPVFSVGFGPRLFGTRRGGTDYRVSAIPLGGYVRLAGDEADEARTGAPEEFLSKPRWQRFFVFVAGASFNLALAVVAAAIMFKIYGKPELAVPDQYPVVADVRQGSTAEASGLRVGDKVVSVGGADARVLGTISEQLMNPDVVKDVVVDREGERLTLRYDTGRDPKYQTGDFNAFAVILASPGPPELKLVLPGGAAAHAGMEAGDEIVEIEGKRGLDDVWLRKIIEKSAGKELRVVVERDGEEIPLAVTPRLQGEVGKIGVEFKNNAIVRRPLGWTGSIAEAVRYNTEMTKRLFLALGSVGSRVASGDVKAVSAFSGPLEIAKFSSAALTDLETFLGFMAMLSLNLGIINLMPIPVLDGGHILILTVEGVIRRDLSEKMKERVMQAGFVFLLAFFALVVFFDIKKTFFTS